MRYGGACLERFACAMPAAHRKVLHAITTCRTGYTWGRTLEYHPHVHYVVPGGGLSADGDRWLPSCADFLVPAKALSPIFRGTFRDILRREGLLRLVNPAVWKRDGWCTLGPPAMADSRYATSPRMSSASPSATIESSPATMARSPSANAAWGQTGLAR